MIRNVKGSLLLHCYSLFAELLTEASDASEIQFTEDGSWQPMKEKEDKHSNQTSSSSADVEMIVDMDDSSDCGTFNFLFFFSPKINKY